jgi:hypothetical protein
VRQRSEEQLPTQTLGWVAAPKGAPAHFQGGMIEIIESRKSLLYGRLVHLEQWHLGGAAA